MRACGSHTRFHGYGCYVLIAHKKNVSSSVNAVNYGVSGVWGVFVLCLVEYGVLRFFGLKHS